MDSETTLPKSSVEEHVPAPEPKDERTTKRSLFYGIATWFVTANVVYALPSLTCKWDWFRFHVGGLSGLQVVQTVVNLIALALMAYLVYLPYRDWRRYQTEKPPENPHMLHDTEKSREPMLAGVIFGLNSFFLLIVLALFVPIFTLTPCG